MPTNDWTMPLFGSSNDRTIGWLRECVQEGAAWLSAQRPAAEWQQLIERIGASIPSADLAGQSNVQYNKTERLAREIVASLGSFAHVGEVAPIADKTLYTNAGVLTKLDLGWNELPETQAAFRTVLQNTVALGTGYAYQIWDKHFWGPHRGDIRLTGLPPTHVTFVQLPADHDLQRAYVVIIREELPINLAKRIYADTNRAFAEALRPDRDSPSWLAQGLRKVQRFLSPALQVAGIKPGDNDMASFPTVDIFHAYIMDGSINEGIMPITMGAPGTNWSYQVPALGDPIPLGKLNPATGQMLTRPAEPSDCLLFPYRRYAIFARSTNLIAYDNTSPWWHGQVPLARFWLNDWPWSALGRSCVGMVRTMEDSVNAILRGMEDSVACRLDPPRLYDDGAVSKSFAEAFNPRRAGSSAAVDLAFGKVIDFPVDPRFYDVPQWISAHVQYLDDRMEYLTGARDLTAIAKAKQLPSGDALEKLLEMAGPLVQDMVKSVIIPLKQLGTMRLAYYLQFYTAQRIVSSTNAHDEAEDWLYSPTDLLAVNNRQYMGDTTKRARALLNEFTYRVSQSGISELNRMTTKLFFLQLMKIPGFPMDWWTFAKVAQLPRFGEEPEGTNSMIERYVAQLRMMAEFQGIAQQELAEATGGMTPQGATGMGGGGGRPGRPNAYTAAPKLVSKEGGVRSTVTTS